MAKKSIRQRKVRSERTGDPVLDYLDRLETFNPDPALKKRMDALRAKHIGATAG